MSIVARIARLEKLGQLVRFVPGTRQPPKRRLFLTQHAAKELLSKNSAVNLLKLGGYVRAAMTRWASGGSVHASDSGKPGFLKRLCGPPPEIWEVRVTDPDVQVRLLGRFAEPDTLILTHFYTRNLLGKKKSRAWQHAMKDCEAAWATLFPIHSPFSGQVIHDYVTENCDEFQI
jgi:hypothetical protein